MRVVLGTALILMVPLVAMQFTPEVNWSLADFVVAGALLAGTGLAFERLSRKATTKAYRAAAGMALAAALLLIWINLAVGLIGDEGNRANLLYLGVLAIGLVGGLLARFRPHGMARALLAMALAQALVAAIALVFRLGGPWTPPLEIVGANGIFVALFLGSAWLFRSAARQQHSKDTPWP